MKRESRRAFFERWIGSAEPASPRGPNLRSSEPLPRPTPPVSPSPATGPTSSFSLEEFYAARTPQRLPPISIRPSVLHYADRITAVGCPPPHEPPALEGDALYAELSRQNQPPRQRG